MPRRILFMILAGSVFFFPGFLSAEPGKQDHASQKDPSLESSDLHSSMVISAPTLPFVPPILPSFYNDPEFAAREYGGRSLNSAFAVCGDGVYDPGEDCDDGNRTGEDGCSDLCRLEDPLSCGDTVTGAGETCDDGNSLDGDGCSATCQSEGICGDGSPDVGEQCDDGNSESGDGCSNRCQFESAKQREVDLRDPFTEVKKKEEAGEKDSEALKEKKDEKQKELLPVKEIDTDPFKPKDKEEDVDVDGERVTRYSPGRAIVTPPGCSAVCTMAEVYYKGALEQQYEVISERRVTGGTYSTAFGEVNCATGQIVGLSESAYSNAAENRASGSQAEVTGCSR